MQTKNTLTDQDTQPQKEGVGWGGRTAYDIKDLHTRLDLNSDVLKQIPIIETGERLQQGGTYIDLKKTNPQPFTATTEQTAEEDMLLVRKSDVAYEIWNHLVGEEKQDEDFEGSPSYETR